MTARRYLTARQVLMRYGGISDATLWRWVHDSKQGFPQPTYLGRRRYFDVAELDAHDQRNGPSSNVLRDRVQQAAAGGDPLTGAELTQLAQLLGAVT